MTKGQQQKAQQLIAAALALGNGYSPGHSVIMDLGKALGWPYATVSRVLRVIAENPQLGWTLMVTRGPYPTLYVSDIATQIPASTGLQNSSESLWLENVRRQGRAAVKVFTAYNNLTEHVSTNARGLKAQRNILKGVLTNEVAFLSALSPQYDALTDWLDDVLKLA